VNQQSPVVAVHSDDPRSLPKHPEQLAQRRTRIRQVAKDEPAISPVEVPVQERQAGCVSGDRQDQRARALQNSPIAVHADDLQVRTRALDPPGHETRSTTEVEHPAGLW
jgi:hypothetical protein